MSEIRKYSNPWIPARAIEILHAESGSVLDVGGGASPYYRASHVIDIMPFDSERLAQNAWGAPRSGGGRRVMATPNAGFARTEVGEQKLEDSLNEEHRWTSDTYTQLDLCAGERWPFDDKQFDLGLSSHCMEDIRDPVQVVKEMGRVCKTVLIVCPSRLFEQMRNVDHPRYCGMAHHLWLVYEESDILCFRRKTPLIEFPNSHFVCPPGKKLNTEAGGMFYFSQDPKACEKMYFELDDDQNEYQQFVHKNGNVSSFLEADERMQGWKKIIWYLRQRYLWQV